MPAYCDICMRSTFTVFFAACEHRFCAACVRTLEECPACVDPDTVICVVIEAR